MSTPKRNQTTTESPGAQLLGILVQLNPLLAKEMRSKDPTIVVGHVGILTFLEQGTTNLSDLANYQGVTLPTMSATINTLVERGWVQRDQSAADRRMVELKLTRRGRAVLDEFRGLLEDSLATLLTPLAPGEREILVAGLTVLQQLLYQTGETPS